MTLGAAALSREKGPVPLYYQLERHLRERIASQEFAPGSCLPSEDQIGEQYGVSRITVRRALDTLQQQGLIQRKHGIGSFVCDHQVGIDSRLSGSLGEFLLTAGALLTHVLLFEQDTPPLGVREALGLAEGERATRLKSVGSLEGEGPVAFLDIWFPLDVGRALDGRQIAGHTPIIRQAEKALNARLTRAEQTIEPDHAGEEAARHLDIAPDAPILKVRRVYYVYPDRPIEVAYVRYHPERYRYAIDFRA